MPTFLILITLTCFFFIYPADIFSSPTQDYSSPEVFYLVMTHGRTFERVGNTNTQNDEKDLQLQSFHIHFFHETYTTKPLNFYFKNFCYLPTSKFSCKSLFASSF